MFRVLVDSLIFLSFLEFLFFLCEKQIYFWPDFQFFDVLRHFQGSKIYSSDLTNESYKLLIVENLLQTCPCDKLLIC